MVQKYLRLMESHLSIVRLNFCDTMVLFRKCFPCLQVEEAYFLLSSPKDSGLMLRFLIHLELSFMQSNSMKSICILPHTGMHVIWPTYYVKYAVFFLDYIYWIFIKCKYPKSIDLCLCVLNLTVLISVFAFVPRTRCCYFIAVCCYLFITLVL